MPAARHPIVTLMMAAALCGCQSVRPAPNPTDDISVRRKQRKAEVVESFEAKRTFAQLEAARSQAQVGDVSGCIESLHSVLERDPQNTEALALMKDVLKPYQQDKQVWGTVLPSNDTLEECLQDCEEDGAIQRASFIEILSSGQPLEDTDSVDEPENPQLAVSAAVLALRHNQPDLALELAQSALARISDDASLHRIVGLAHYRRGDFESSQLALQQSLSLDSRHPLTYFLLGHTMQKLGAADTAEWCFAQARRVNATEAAP